MNTELGTQNVALPSLFLHANNCFVNKTHSYYEFKLVKIHNFA